VIQYVLKQSFQLRQLLAPLPEPSSWLISEHIFKAVADIIETYDIAGCYRPGKMTCRRQYQEVCLYNLKAVFLPCMEECNFRKIWSQFVEEFLSQSLQTNLNINCLIILLTLCIKASRSILHKLTVLQEFRFEFCCTTDIVTELERHCILLKVLDVTSSKFVTNDCVEYLLKLRSLEKLLTNSMEQSPS
jgi:hypothetical protein